MDTSIDETLVIELLQLINALNEWDQSNSLEIINNKYIISKTNANANANANYNSKKANTQTFEMTTPPPTPPKNPTNSPSGDCDININYDDKTVTIKIVDNKCGINNDKLKEIIEQILKEILEEILKEFVNIFENIHKVDVEKLVKGVFIAIVVDTIFEDLCKNGNSKNLKICNYPEIKILINVIANNLTDSPVQKVAKITIGVFKANAELSTLQDMIKKFYVNKYKENIKLFNSQQQTN